MSAGALRSLAGGRAAAVAEVFAREANGDGTLANRRRNSFDRAAAHVAEREHSRQAGFEQVGIAAELLPHGHCAGVAAEIGAGDDERVAVQLDRVTHPLHVRFGGDQDEQCRGGERQSRRRVEIFDNDVFEPSGAGDLLYRNPRHDGDGGLPSDPVKKVLRHGRRRTVTADDNRDWMSTFGERRCCVARCVAAAHDDHGIAGNDLVLASTTRYR